MTHNKYFVTMHPKTLYRMKHLILLCLLSLPAMLTAQDQRGNVLKKLLKQNPAYFEQVLRHAKKHRLQILYTQINRDAQNRPTFKSYSYRISEKEYFYPASLVKLPVCALALEKLGEIPDADAETSLVFGASRPSQTPLSQDSLSPTNRPNLANYIHRALVVSDNDTYNRLYEFLGQGYIQRKLKEKGYKNSLIAHRLSRPIYDEEEERHTNPCALFLDHHQIWQQEAQYNTQKHNIVYRNTKVGKAYYKRGELIQTPYDFRGRNFLSLPEMQKMLQVILFPDAFPAQERFNLKPADYELLKLSLSMYPRESQMPVYDQPFHTDNFMKYYLPTATAPSNIRIFNKVGMAFGFLIDNAYIIDYEASTEFFLSVVMYANADETLNDDKYEYETISKPFMQNLAKVIGEYERGRKIGRRVER